MITPEQGVVVAGRYTLVRPLARGGMGSVWIARHRDLEIDVTVKFMAPALVASTEARIRFEREAKVAARLRSQHVVQVLDYGMEDGTPYIAMELLKGESLYARLTREGRLALPVTARLLVQICKALRTAHDEGLVHRDLKPGNVFLALKDEDEVVKVLDFGIAKAASLGDARADTESGVLLGSAHYMSPEQIRSSRTVDHRSDLWSLGVILYRTLTGRLPFPSGELGNVLVSVCTDPIPSPSSIAPDLPPGIDGFFERALARDPDQRFPSALELSEAFSAMALQAPARPLSRSAPRWNATIPILPVVSAGTMGAGEVAKNGTFQRLTPEPAPAPPAPPMQPTAPPQGARQRMFSSSDNLAFAVQPAVDTATASIPAVPPPAPRAEPAMHVVRPAAGGRRFSARSWWPVGVLAAVVALAGIAGVVLRSGATSGSATPVASSAVTATSPDAGVQPVTHPQASSVAIGLDSARPPSQESPASSLRSDPSADAGVGAAKAAPTSTGQPRASVRGPQTPAVPTWKPAKDKVDGPLEKTL